MKHGLELINRLFGRGWWAGCVSSVHRSKLCAFPAHGCRQRRAAVGRRRRAACRCLAGRSGSVFRGGGLFTLPGGHFTNEYTFTTILDSYSA